MVLQQRQMKHGSVLHATDVVSADSASIAELCGCGVYVAVDHVDCQLDCPAVASPDHAAHAGLINGDEAVLSCIG